MSLNNEKCVSLNNEKSCMIQPTFINLHPNEYSQKKLHYYPIAVNLDSCAGCCNSLDDLCQGLFYILGACVHFFSTHLLKKRHFVCLHPGNRCHF